MTRPFAEPLYWPVQGSAICCWGLALAHLLAVAVVVALVIGRPLFVLLLVPLLVSSLYGWRQAAAKTANAVVRLECATDGRWRWQTRSGAAHEGELHSHLVLGDWLVLLYLKPAAGRRRRIAVFRDAMSADGHRHLRARVLRWPESPDAAPGA